MNSDSLSFRNVLALGFMTFALFVGAGNIIFPPLVGLQSGEHVWYAAAGFLITAVGLPVVALVALARAGGGIDILSAPVGRRAGMILSVICYLAVGPLFAIPRAATVSFEIGIAPFTEPGAVPLLIYSLIYFVLVAGLSLYPHHLLDTIGHFLAPLKIISLIILGIAAIFWPCGSFVSATDVYEHKPFSAGFINGYLTMDTLGAMVFGLVIINTVRNRGIFSPSLLTRYTLWAGIIAGSGMTLVYLSLFKLGAESGALVNGAGNGAVILHAYVQYAFGNVGHFFLSALIFIACMVTAVGLTCSCAEFFSKQLPLSYRTLVFMLTAFSMLFSNAGLNTLIEISLPLLTAIYPPCILLIILSFTAHWWNNASRVFVPVLLVSLFFGVLDAIKISAFASQLPARINSLPLIDHGLAWFLPSLLMMGIVGLYDRVYCHQEAHR